MNYLLFITAVLAVVFGVHCQSPPNCESVMSRSALGLLDVTCRCGQAPQKTSTSINILRIDLSDCAWNETARGISWQGLDSEYQPRVIELIKVEVFFASPNPQPWDSTVRRIDFRDCFIPNVTSEAFKGLANLEEIHFFNSFINLIQRHGVSQLPNLRTLEFSNTYIGEIGEDAINNVPNVRDLAFHQSHVEVINRNGINNMKLPTLPTSTECPEIDVRTSRAELSFMNDLTSRMLESTENLPLPKYGARLLFLHSSIGTLFTNSITSDLFAFAIFGGNTIVNFGERSLNLQLSNQCEISAVMFSTNNIVNLHEGAFASATSYATSNHATYFVLTNNTFENVAPNAFLIHPTIRIFKMENNFFACDCNLISWVFEDDLSSSQTELEALLLQYSQCNVTNQNLSEFVNTCSRPTPPPFQPTTTPWNGFQPTHNPVMTFTEQALPPVVVSAGNSVTTHISYTILSLTCIFMLVKSHFVG